MNAMVHAKPMAWGTTAKRVGVLTFHHTNNYGGCLQAYSLVQFLRCNGYAADLIDYRPWRVHLPAELGSLFSLSAIRWNLKRNGRLPAKLTSMPAACISHHLQVRRVLGFLHQMSVLSRHRCFTRNSLRRAATAYDCLVTGSDEVWKLDKRRREDWSYFLDFARDGVKRLSYAASCGARMTFGEHRANVEQLLSGFYAISVRDRNTQSVIERECRRSAELVVDPAWFLDLSIARDVRLVDERYVLLLGAISPQAIQRIRAFCRRRNLALVAVGSHVNQAHRSYVGLDPRTWLSAIRNAEFVFTNLYHGTIFAIRYRRNFVTVCPENKLIKVSELLRSLGLEERILGRDLEGADCAIVAEPIHFDEVQSQLAERFRTSQHWLLRNCGRAEPACTVRRDY